MMFEFRHELNFVQYYVGMASLEGAMIKLPTRFALH